MNFCRPRRTLKWILDNNCILFVFLQSHSTIFLWPQSLWRQSLFLLTIITISLIVLLTFWFYYSFAVSLCAFDCTLAMQAIPNKNCCQSGRAARLRLLALMSQSFLSQLEVFNLRLALFLMWALIFLPLSLFFPKSKAFSRATFLVKGRD
jgi:hypothetical protein